MAKKESKHAKLVDRIIDKFAEVEESPDTEGMYRARLPRHFAFYTHTDRATKKEALATLRSMLIYEFDNNNIILSDTWEEENL